MSVGSRYALDANIFIQAYRMYYTFDICPGFWDALIRQHRLSNLCSVDRVKAELVHASDPLAEWAKKTVPKGFFKGTADRQVVDTFGDMVKWVQTENQFTPEAKAQFASVADGWLIAFAKVNGLTVVTHEEYAPAAKRSVKIPNVCLEFKVDFCDTFKMLRGVREQFVLKTRRKER